MQNKIVQRLRGIESAILEDPTFQTLLLSEVTQPFISLRIEEIIKYTVNHQRQQYIEQLQNQIQQIQSKVMHDNNQKSIANLKQQTDEVQNRCMRFEKQIIDWQHTISQLSHTVENNQTQYRQIDQSYLQLAQNVTNIQKHVLIPPNEMLLKISSIQKELDLVKAQKVSTSNKVQKLENQLENATKLAARLEEDLNSNKVKLLLSNKELEFILTNLERYNQQNTKLRESLVSLAAECNQKQTEVKILTQQKCKNLHTLETARNDIQQLRQSLSAQEFDSQSKQKVIRAISIELHQYKSKLNLETYKLESEIRQKNLLFSQIDTLKESELRSVQKLKEKQQLERSIVSLKKQINGLQEQLKTCHKESEAFVHHNQKQKVALFQEINKLTDQAYKSEFTQGSLLTQLQQKNRLIEKLQNQFKLNHQRALLEEQKALILQFRAIEELRTSLKLVQEQKDEIMLKYRQTNQECLRQTAQIKAQSDHIAEAYHNYKQLQKQHNELLSTCKQLERQLYSKASQIKQLQLLNEAKDIKNKEYKTEVSERQAQHIKQLSDIANSHKQTIKNLKGEYQIQKQQLKVQYEERLQAGKVQSTKDIDQLTKRLHKRQMQIDNLNHKIRDMAQDWNRRDEQTLQKQKLMMSKRQEQLHSAEVYQQKLQQEIGIFNKQIQNKQNQYRGAKNQIHQLESKLIELTKKIKLKDHQSKNMVHQLDLHKKEMIQLMGENQRLKVAYQTQKSILTNKVKSISTSVKSLKASNMSILKSQVKKMLKEGEKSMENLLLAFYRLVTEDNNQNVLLKQKLQTSLSQIKEMYDHKISEFKSSVQFYKGQLMMRDKIVAKYERQLQSEREASLALKQQYNQRNKAILNDKLNLEKSFRRTQGELKKQKQLNNHKLDSLEKKYTEVLQTSRDKYNEMQEKILQITAKKPSRNIS